MEAKRDFSIGCPPPPPTRALVEFEIEPRTAFGLADGKTVIQAARDNELRSRTESEAVNETLRCCETDCTLRDNILTVSMMVENRDLFGAVDIATGIVHDFLVAAGLRSNLTFYATYRRVWSEDGTFAGAPQWRSHSSAQWDTSALSDDFRSAARWVSESDASFRSALLFYRRGVWAYEAGSGAVRGNWVSIVHAQRETGWAAAIAIVLFNKAVACLTDDEDSEKRRARLGAFGFDPSAVDKFEEYRGLRNRVIHDEWEDKDPNFLNDSYGRFRELTRQLLMRRGKEIEDEAAPHSGA